MEFFDWDEQRYTVFVPEMDSQHKVLVAIVNRFYEASQLPPNKAANGKLVNELIDYTKYHFSAEEKLLETQGFADCPMHKAMHGNLLNNVAEIRKEIEASNGMISPETMEFLKLWLVSHILGSDKKYGEFLRSKRS